MSVKSTGVPQTRVQWVDEQLREAILTGALCPGERLRLSALTQRFGVSATPLREAFQRLATEGLIDLTPQQGASVSNVSADDCADLYRARAAIEPTMLSMSLSSGHDLVAGAAAACEVLVHEVRRQPWDLKRFEHAHVTYHQLLMSQCGSEWLLRTSRTMSDHSRRYRLLSTGPRGGAEAVVREHSELQKAVESGDVGLAVDRLRQHIMLTADMVAAQLTGPATHQPHTTVQTPVRP